MSNIKLNKNTQLPEYEIADIVGLAARLVSIEDLIGDIGAVLDIINGEVIG